MTRLAATRTDSAPCSARLLPNRDQASDTMINILAHDVRNSIRALGELPIWIREDLVENGHDMSDALAMHCDLMVTHSKRLDRMLLDLLVYCRIGRDQAFRTIRLRDAIAQSIDLVDPAGRFSVAHDCGNLALHFGERDIVTLFSALISNAIKHNPAGHGHIRLSARSDRTDCTIDIQDDGPGIPNDCRDRIFEAMTTLRPRDEVEGSGMGLTIARKITDHYGGRVRWVPGDNGRCSRLELRLPLTPGQPVAEPPP